MTINSVPLPSALQEFIDSVRWTFTETIPEWPHEYIVRDQVDENLFMLLVQHIRSQGYEAKFYEKTFTYYDHRGMVYWTMGEPIGETTAIYRCRKEDSYESRRLKGTFPEAKVIGTEQKGRSDRQ
ncbi:MAG: hypothetical protein JW902_15400 [Syntrophaceae bacterium]|nr:hypothetical protein [Syntrophaceae bacterium]